MADVSKEVLVKEITAILKGADLATTSAKKLREGVETKLGIDLSNRKKEVDHIAIRYLMESGKKGSMKNENENYDGKGKDPDETEEDAINDITTTTGSIHKKDIPAKCKKTSSDKRKDTSEGKRKGGWSSGKPVKVTPELAAIIGVPAMKRHEVVKKVWSIIKEQNLFDPKDKRYAYCNADLLKVIGVQRFRTFAMMKYLNKHFVK